MDQQLLQDFGEVKGTLKAMESSLERIVSKLDIVASTIVSHEEQIKSLKSDIEDVEKRRFRDWKIATWVTGALWAVVQGAAWLFGIIRIGG